MNEPKRQWNPDPEKRRCPGCGVKCFRSGKVSRRKRGRSLEASARLESESGRIGHRGRVEVHPPRGRRADVRAVAEKRKASDWGPKFPFVRCDAHPGEDEPGYAVCQHVIDGAAVFHFERASETNLGTVICFQCRNCDHPEVLVLCCAHSVRDAGWDRVDRVH